MKIISAWIALAFALSPTICMAKSEEDVAAYCDDVDFTQSQLCFALRYSDEMIGVENSSGSSRMPGEYYILARFGAEWSIYARRVARGQNEAAANNWRTTETREIVREIPPDQADAVKAAFSPDFTSRLDATQPYPEDTICLDGSFLNLIIKTPDKTGVWGRHSCLQGTAIDEAQEILRSVAFEADPALIDFSVRR